MKEMAGIRPRWLGAMALWAGSDHYSLWQALRAQDFHLPVERVARVYRIDFHPALGFGLRSRFVVAYRSERRECLVVLDSLPAALAHFKPVAISPVGAMQLYLKLVWNEPAAILSLLLIPLPIFLVMILFLLWVNLVIQNPDILSLFSNESCDAVCASKVLKVHSMVGALFLMPFALVILPVGLMVFQAPRYRSAVNYRFAQSYCAITVAIGVYLLAQLMVFFPFKNYGKFVMSGFGPRAELFLKNRHK